ncbi:hypothetical protein KKG58_05905 [Patescibacteria group bacterium]|nr:hypothetical protein [Patescibacteria group bacterium]
MTSNKRIVGLAVLALTLVLTAGLSSVYAFQGGFGSKRGEFSPEKFQEMTEKRGAGAMNEIFENNDYEAWKSLMQEKVNEMEKRVGEMKEKINEENFSQMTEIHNLMQQGEYEKAKELKQELGFGPMGIRKGEFRNHRFNSNTTE